MRASGARIIIGFWGLLAGTANLLIPAQVPDQDATADFGRYWHQGRAEISRFELEQVRYGQVRRGDAVLIFVTEDFLPEEQVKYEGNDPGAAGALPVLKMNQIRRFPTGIYDYSLMLSVFTPENLEAHPRTLKTTASIQDWCGQTWLQANLRSGAYMVAGHSYFQKEADERITLEAAFLEDALWTTLRLGPGKLPVGRVRMIPGSFDIRLQHRRPAVEDAEAVLLEAPHPEGDLRVYQVTYPETGRTLRVTFQAEFPHRIRDWEEELLLPDRRMLMVKATRTHLQMIDYWARNQNEDATLRAELGLK